MPSISFNFTPAALRLRVNEPETPTEPGSDPAADDEVNYPHEQLKLVHAEVTRQRTAVATRLGSMHTRGVILVTASGLTTTVLANSWISGWQFIGVLLTLAAAILGLWAVRPSKGIDANVTLHLNERLQAEPYETEHSIVMDSIAGLKDDMEKVELLGKQIVVGYGILVASWIAMPVMVVLVNAKII